MPTLRPVGLQLYTLRDAIVSDLVAVLEQVAEIGYVGVEPYGGIDYEKAAPRLKALRLEVPSMHADLPLGDDKNKVLEMASAYGVKHIIAPYRPPEDFQTVDGIKATCDVLNEAAAIATENGYSFGYHNHWWEYEPVDGRPAYQIMLEHLDPAVYMEIDTYWVKTGGVDPVKVIAEFGQRAPLLHIKDGPAIKGEPHVAVGAGTLNIAEIVQAGQDYTEWLIVELDACATDMMKAVQQSYQFLVNQGLARGKNS